MKQSWNKNNTGSNNGYQGRKKHRISLGTVIALLIIAVPVLDITTLVLSTIFGKIQLNNMELPDMDATVSVACADNGSISPPDESEIDFSDSTISEIHNELLLAAADGVTEEQISELISPMGGTVVGQIKNINYYQVRFGQDYSTEELDDMNNELEKSTIVDSAFGNYAFVMDEQSGLNAEKQEKMTMEAEGYSYIGGPSKPFEKSIRYHEAVQRVNDAFELEKNVGTYVDWLFTLPGVEHTWTKASITPTLAISEKRDLLFKKDKSFDKDWIEFINAPSAREVMLTDRGYEAPENKIRVGVIDSYLDVMHPDIYDPELKDKSFIISESSGNFYDKSAVSYNAFKNDYRSANGTNSHGTHVTGIINAHGKEFQGVNPNSQIYFSNMYHFIKGNYGWYGYESISDIMWKISTLVGKYNCRVINFSRGGFVEYSEGDMNSEKAAISDLEELRTAFEHCFSSLDEQGCDFLMVFAAGNGVLNEGYGTDVSYCNMANVLSKNTSVSDHVIFVGNVSNTLIKSPHNLQNEVGDNVNIYRAYLGSNYGELVDVFAPGVDIYSCVIKKDDISTLNKIKNRIKSVRYHEYKYENDLYHDIMSGTSMATPVVSGIASLAYEAYPELTSAQVKELLMENYTYRAIDWLPKADGTYRHYPIPDAEKVVEGALRIKKEEAGRKKLQEAIEKEFPIETIHTNDPYELLNYIGRDLKTLDKQFDIGDISDLLIAATATTKDLYIMYASAFFDSRSRLAYLWERQEVDEENRKYKVNGIQTDEDILKVDKKLIDDGWNRYDAGGVPGQHVYLYRKGKEDMMLVSVGRRIILAGYYLSPIPSISDVIAFRLLKIFPIDFNVGGLKDNIHDDEDETIIEDEGLSSEVPGEQVSEDGLNDDEDNNNNEDTYEDGTDEDAFAPATAVEEEPALISDGSENNNNKEKRRISEFIAGVTNGRDNNSYSHSKTDGFHGVSTYRISDEYFNRLTQGLTSSQVDSMTEKSQEEWIGSCYGIASTISLLFNRNIDISSLTDRTDVETYFELGKPCDDSAFLNAIQYYQLSQYRPDGGDILNSSITYSNTKLASMLKSVTTGDKLSVFLEKFVNATDKGKPVLFGYSYLSQEGFGVKSHGHAIVALASEFDEESQKYRVEIYDENHKEDVLYMYVDKDYSDFEFKDGNGHPINKQYTRLYFQEMDNLYNAVGFNKKPLSDEEQFGSYVNTILFVVKSVVQIINDRNESLFISLDTVSGNMPLEDIGFITKSMEGDEGDSVELSLQVEPSESYTIISDGGQVDLSIVAGDHYYSVEGYDIGTVELHDGEIELEKNPESEDFVFDAAVSSHTSDSDTGLVSFSGKTTGNVTVKNEKNKTYIDADDPVIGLTSYNYNTGTVSFEPKTDSEGRMYVTARKELPWYIRYRRVIAIVAAVIFIVLIVLLILFIIKRRKQKKKN